MINKKYGVSAHQISKYGFKLCLEVYEKCNRKCSVCSSEERLAIHHIDGKGQHYEEKGLEPNNDLTNLDLICIRCHGRFHRLKYCEEQAGIRGGYLKKGREKEYEKEKYQRKKRKIRS